MSKKLILAAGLVTFMAFTTIMTFKAFERLSELDLSDPFEVDFDDE